MYVYDEANNLAKAIQESKEYKEYKKIKEEIDAVPEMKAKIEDFEKTRYEVQVMSFQGEKQDEEKMKKLQEMYNVLNTEPKIKEYFDIEVRFNIMLADVNKIISESVKDLLYILTVVADPVSAIIYCFTPLKSHLNEKTQNILTTKQCFGKI